MSPPEAQIQLSATDRRSVRIPWKLRSDLQMIADRNHHSHDWIIKDPLRLTYFFVSAEGLTFLSLCNGCRSLEEIAAQLTIEFPNSDVSSPSLLRLLQSAVRAGILASTEPGYGRILSLQKSTPRIPALLALPSRLSFRWRGFDPTGLIRILHPFVSWIFRPSSLFLLLIAATASALMLLGRWHQFTGELPTIRSLLTFQNILYVTITAAIVKGLHELGHALACCHFGGECHEVGILWVLIFPIPYCDVTDSWTMNSKSHRMAIAFAGIFVEMVVAISCFFLWMFSNPGLLHSYFLNVMLLCSINTLLVNGNPLLKYDGYYVLSDLIGVPNLATEGKLAAISWLRRIILGTKGQPTFRSPAEVTLLAVWGTISGLYRTGMTVTLMLFIYLGLKPWGLHYIAALPALSMATGFVSMLYHEIRGARDAVSSRRLSLRLAIVTAIVCGILLMPISLPVKAPCVISPGTATPVFVAVGGSITPAVSHGQKVKAGDLLATLTNHELSLQIAKLEGEIHVIEVQQANLEAMRRNDAAVAGALAAAEQSAISAKARLKTLNDQRSQLEIRSPKNGVVWMPRNRVRKDPAFNEPAFWCGSPLDQKNESAWIDPQTLLCWVGTETDIRVSAVVDEASLELLDAGTPATIRLLSSPNSALNGKLESISGERVESVDRELLLNHLIPTSPNSPDRPASTCFRAIIVPDLNTSKSAVLYQTGTVRLDARPRSLISWGWRFLSHAFSFAV